MFHNELIIPYVNVFVLLPFPSIKTDSACIPALRANSGQFPGLLLWFFPLKQYKDLWCSNRRSLWDSEQTRRDRLNIKVKSEANVHHCVCDFCAQVSEEQQVIRGLIGRFLVGDVEALTAKTTNRDQPNGVTHVFRMTWSLVFLIIPFSFLLCICVLYQIGFAQFI